MTKQELIQAMHKSEIRRLRKEKSILMMNGSGVKMAENRCDELFGKNGELVEFRKKQVLEGALEIVQRNYEDKPNKMGVIAALFNKKNG